MNPLFSHAEIFSVIEYQKQELKKAFQRVTNADLDADPVAVAAKLQGVLYDITDYKRFEEQLRQA